MSASADTKPSLALLKGNRFNPWHLQVYKHLPRPLRITAFRAESEIQQHFQGRDDGSAPFETQRIYFTTETGSPATRLWRRAARRLTDEEPRIAPFHDRLKGYDVIQTWELFTDWSREAIAAKHRFGIPVAVMVWDNIPFNHEDHPDRLAIKAEVLKSADVFLVHTERSRRMLWLEGVEDCRIRMVNPGVDTDAFSPGPAERAGFGCDEDDFVILFVGWLLPRKGIDFLMMAVRGLSGRAARTRPVRLLVIGSGPGEDRVRTLAQRLDIMDRCQFAGSVPYNHMPAAFRSADCFVLPSIATPAWQEQFGMSLIEAMACGCPVAASLCGAVPEIAGDAAMLFQPNDFLAIENTLETALQNPEMLREFAQKGRRRALDHFDIRHSARQLQDVYDSLR